MLISDLQLSLRHRLATDPFFSGSPPVDVIARCQKDAVAMVRERLGSVSRAVLIWSAEGEFTNNDCPTPTVRVGFDIKCIENTALPAPGNQPTAEEMAWAAARLFWGWIPTHHQTQQRLTASPCLLSSIKQFETEWKPVGTSGSGPGTLIYNAEFTVTVLASDKLITPHSARGGN